METEEIISQAQQRLLQKREALGVTDSPIRLISKPDEGESFAAPSCLMTEEEIIEIQRKALAPPGMSIFSSGIPVRYQKCNFETYSGNDKLIAGLKSYAEAGESIVLTGGTGTGKTHLAVAIMRHINYESSRFVTVPSLLMEIRDSFRPNATASEADIVDKYACCRMLCLDDLGAEKTSEFSIATLYLILDKRVSNLRQTIITTNLSLTEVEATLGARIASRLSEMKIARITAPDYRKRRAQ